MLNAELMSWSVRTLVILQELDGSGWSGRVSLHDVVVEQSRATEQTEAAGTTEDTAEHVLRRLLEPMADGVLKHLVPHHRTWNIRQCKRHSWKVVRSVLIRNKVWGRTWGNLNVYWSSFCSVVLMIRKPAHLFIFNHKWWRNFYFIIFILYYIYLWFLCNK